MQFASSSECAKQTVDSGRTRSNACVWVHRHFYRVDLPCNRSVFVFVRIYEVACSYRNKSYRGFGMGLNFLWTLVLLFWVKKLNAAWNLSSVAKSYNIGDVTLDFDKIEGMEVLEDGSALLMSESGINYLLRSDRKCLNKYMKLWEWNNARDYSGNKQQK